MDFGELMSKPQNIETNKVQSFSKSTNLQTTKCNKDSIPYTL